MGGPSRKIKSLLDILSDKFLKCYSPGQELSVDEGMVKYKGRAKGKVHMPNKPVKVGFKIWCCSCSCCGYLCTFQVYHGRPIDPLMGEKVSEKGLTMRVVSDLTAPFEGLNHVVYCDNYFTSGPLVEMLAKKKIFLAGNVFPKQMDSKVARVQPDGVLRYQSVPPLLPAYNKYMCGV